MIVAISSGIGIATFPSQRNLLSSFLISSKVSISMTSVSLSMHSCVTFGRSFFETKSTLDSEWFRMLVTSLADDSGRIGMAMRPNGTVEKNATVHSGMFCARIATLSDAPIPNCVSLFDSISHVRLNSSYVYSCSVSMTFDIRFFAYLRVEYS